MLKKLYSTLLYFTLLASTRYFTIILITIIFRFIVIKRLIIIFDSRQFRRKNVDVFVNFFELHCKIFENKFLSEIIILFTKTKNLIKSCNCFIVMYIFRKIAFIFCTIQACFLNESRTFILTKFNSIFINSLNMFVSFLFKWFFSSKKMQIIWKKLSNRVLFWWFFKIVKKLFKYWSNFFHSLTNKIQRNFLTKKSNNIKNVDNSKNKNFFTQYVSFQKKLSNQRFDIAAKTCENVFATNSFNHDRVDFYS